MKRTARARVNASVELHEDVGGDGEGKCHGDCRGGVMVEIIQINPVGGWWGKAWAGGRAGGWEGWGGIKPGALVR